jgi:hypothetical protein
MVKSAANGNTLVRTLSKIYGQGFAAGYAETAKLSEVMLQLNETSLSQLRRDRETEHLQHKLAQASKIESQLSTSANARRGNAGQQIIG